MNTTAYDLTKDEVTQIYNHVNELTDDTSNPETGNFTVIQSLNQLHQEIERLLPASWWPDRDQQFDELRTFLKSVADHERRENRVIEFINHLTTLLLNGELDVEP